MQCISGGMRRRGGRVVAAGVRVGVWWKVERWFHRPCAGDSVLLSVCRSGRKSCQSFSTTAHTCLTFTYWPCLKMPCQPAQQSSSFRHGAPDRCTSGRLVCRNLAIWWSRNTMKTARWSAPLSQTFQVSCHKIANIQTTYCANLEFCIQHFFYVVLSSRQQKRADWLQFHKYWLALQHPRLNLQTW